MTTVWVSVNDLVPGREYVIEWKYNRTPRYDRAGVFDRWEQNRAVFRGVVGQYTYDKRLARQYPVAVYLFAEVVD